jgi:hypothetical protein
MRVEKVRTTIWEADKKEGGGSKVIPGFVASFPCKKNPEETETDVFGLQLTGSYSCFELLPPVRCNIS